MTFECFECSLHFFVWYYNFQTNRNDEWFEDFDDEIYHPYFVYDDDPNTSGMSWQHITLFCKYKWSSYSDGKHDDMKFIICPKLR